MRPAPRDCPAQAPALCQPQGHRALPIAAVLCRHCRCFRYVLAYIESSRRGVRRGERLWQLSFGSGFKCNSAVWTANRRVQERHAAWEGFDEQRMEADLAVLPR